MGIRSQIAGAGAPGSRLRRVLARVASPLLVGVTEASVIFGFAELS
jgi:hypothetical protein